MKADRFERLKEILLRAADLSETERAAYLEEACKNDPDLRKEAESILAHDADPSVILQTGGGHANAREDAPTATTEASQIPRQIAGYRIVRKLGEGGMGIVYEAEQQSPRRPVALKIVRGGAYVDEHRVRLFQREAQTLGRLKHPSIAAIYEAGRTEDGQHFFAMELVRGVPLDEYLQSHPLRQESHKADIRPRLGLFQQICDAINYAHQRGIIHRDLKPSNILVLPRKTPSRSGSSGEQTQIKILDFGLARMTDADVTMTTLATEAGRIQGTLAYMSPEQARGNPDEIDLRSDVYSLGVILYELLTDQPPYDVRKTLIPEAVRVICQESPRRPSTIVKSLRGDLETIALKALEKEPARRYQSAAALADDVERYLSDQPILARPPSAPYQFRKLVARHKAPFAFAGILFVLLTAFGITMTGMYQGQRAERARAELEAERARQINDFLEYMLAPSRHREVGWGAENVTVKELLDRASENVQIELTDQPEIRASIESTIGKAYWDLHDWDSAESHLAAAAETQRQVLGNDHPDLGSTLNQLAWAIAHREKPRHGPPETDKLATAEKIVREALTINRKAHGGEHRELARSFSFLGDIQRHQGKLADAEASLRHALAIAQEVPGKKDQYIASAANDLGLVLAAAGVHAEAESLFLAARDLNLELSGRRHAGLATNFVNLGGLYLQTGRYDEAEASFRKAHDLWVELYGEERKGDVYWLGKLMIKKGDYGAADSLLTTTLAVRRQIWGEKHTKVAQVLYELGESARHQSDHAKAGSFFREAADVYRDVEGPRGPSLGKSLTSLGGSLVDLDRLPEAESVLREVLDIEEGLSRPAEQELAISRYQLGRCLMKMGRHNEAEKSLLASYESQRATPGKGRTCMERLVELYEAWGKPDRAGEYREKLAALESRAGEGNP